MSSSRSAALLLLAAAVCAFAPPVFAADPVHATPVFGNAYPLKAAEDGTLGVRIAITGAANVNPAALKVRTMDVADAANDRHPSWTECVKAVNDNRANATPAIVVTACPALPPGVYAVTISIVKDANAPPQKLLVQLTRPAAELRPLATQTIDRVVSLVRSQSSAPKSLILNETTGRMPLTGVTVRRAEDVTFENRPIPVTIGFTAPATAEVGRAELPITLEGDFPYGTAKTVVQVRANELAAPLYVAYEIRTRLHGWLLLPAILCGLLLGYLTRVLLKNFVEKRKVKVAALDLLDRIRTERRRRRDATFAAAAAALEQRLADELTRKTVTAASIKTIDGDFAQALTELQQRIAAVRTAITNAASITSSPDDYPPAIAAALAKARTAFAAAAAAVEAGDATTAKEALDAANDDLAREIDIAANAWRIAVENALNTQLPPLPKPIQETFAHEANRLRAELAKVPAGQQKPPAEIVKAVHPAAFAVRHQFAPRVLAPLADYAQRVVDLLANTGKSTAHAAPALTALHTAIATDADVTLARPLAAAAALLEGLRKDITAVAQAAGSDVSNELNAGEYLQAAQNAEQGAMQGGPASDSIAIPGTPAAPRPFFLPDVVVPQGAAPHDPIVIARRRGLREIFVAELAQFVIAAIGIALVGLLFLLPSFDGTWRGLLTAVFWGYAGDISIDALTEGAKRQSGKT